jgi:hypothetical protein
MKHACSLLVLLALTTTTPAADEAKADPAATKLFTEARAARAVWHDFPGFTADLEVNLGGKVAHGTVQVSPKGKVEVKLDDEAAARWARQELGSVVAHRLDSGAVKEVPCTFAEANPDNPLGRAIRPLDDEFHSSYRVRGRQLLVVNRRMKDTHFTITVLENKRNKEKHFLPLFYVVNSWQARAGGGEEVLKSSQAFHQTWTRVGAFDLPVAVTVVTATAGSASPEGQLEARSLKLSKHKLLP